MKHNIKKLRQMKLLTINLVRKIIWLSRKNLKTLLKPARKFLSKWEQKFGGISTVILLRFWITLKKKKWEICKKLDKISIKDCGTVEKIRWNFEKSISFE